MNDTERALCDEIARHKETQRHLAKAQLRYAACADEYRRVIADLTACRTNALAAAQERDALKATLAEAREACHVEGRPDGYWLVLKNKSGEAAINLDGPSRGPIVRAVIKEAAG